MSTEKLVVIETRGLMPIVDGREFVVEEWPADPLSNLSRIGLPTPDNEPYILSMNGGGRPELTLPVDDHLPTSCGECGGAFKRSIISHNERWMYTVLSCTSHPEKLALLDIFIKKLAGSEYEWTNAFRQKALPAIPSAIIGNTINYAEEYRDAKVRATGRILLTADGLQI